jgi:hypothetical protein
VTCSHPGTPYRPKPQTEKQLSALRPVMQDATAELLMHGVTEVTTTGASMPPDSVNGIYTRWQSLPLLGGFAYLPRGSANFWFLATE